ncbi:CBS domain-containing protein [Candidatus Entotheonella palauensis]|uniref:CBS domain-containing protein n=1 Tax=Candidatus Entotheonella palauensis TaxID=93172 RepID=UPI0015C4A4BB|nr:CBS domain-containing protein [Candidatus Entotheonella palauensis]
MKVLELMSTNVVTVNPTDDLRLVDDIMSEHRIRHLPVVENGTLVGLVTHCDMYKAQISSVMAYGEMGQRAFLHTILVQDIMTHPVLTIAPEASVTEAVNLILNQGIGCLPVTKKNQLIGIVTKTNLLELLRALSTSDSQFRCHANDELVKSTHERYLNF